VSEPATLPVLIVHDREHAIAALRAAREAGVRVRLATAPGAAAYAGAGYLAAVIAAAAAAVPEAGFEAVIDCGEDAGHALAALRAGWRLIRSGRAAALAPIAEAACARVVEAIEGPACDLLDAEDALAAARAHLAPAHR